MSNLARVFRVFIGSPGDVRQERDIARDIIYDWNGIYAPSRGIMLQPFAWETHSVPEMGAPPQKILNKQLLKAADVLIAVFWTRIGTPTGTHRGGTVEEIEEHLAAGKPALIYFSDVPIRPDSVDDVQYQALRQFKESMKNRGLLDSYSTIEEFTEKLTRHVHTLFTDSQRFPAAGQDSGSPHVTIDRMREEIYSPPAGGLSIEAIEVLTTAAKGDGRITALRHLGGMHIEAGGRVFDTSTTRLQAKWLNGVEQLVSEGYTRALGYENEVFEVTEKGYQMADVLQLPEE